MRAQFVFAVAFGIFAVAANAASPVPRTPDGHPDLQGIWTNVTLTTLERPAGFAGKATLTDAEAVAFEKKEKQNTLDGPVDSKFLQQAGSSGTGAYNDLFFDRGSELARVDGVKRTSLIVDPPDGRVPALTADARARNASMRRGGLESAQDRPLSERCLLGFGSTSGPPMLPVSYNNNYQIVQTPDSVAILTEMIHDVRIVRMNGTHPPQNIRQWLGDSIGHWEGDTLVVETTNFTDQTRFRGSSDKLRVIERFTRADKNTILYKATVDDPSTFSKQWTMEIPFVATPGPVYEYACHEGNYSITDILGGARKEDEAAGRK